MTHQQLLGQILRHPKITPRLTGQRTRAGDEIAWCIFHEDGRGKPPHKPDMRIGPKGYICFRCGEKGSLQKLARHLGIGRRSRSRELVKVWDYYTPDGAAKLFQKCRFQTPDSKDYGLRRRAPEYWRDCPHRARCQKQKPDCYGGWIWSLREKCCSPACPPVLYNQPALGAAPADSVHLPEGEQCCDALSALGLLAVCNPHGAGEWRPEYSEALRGRELLVWVDADTAGRDHGELVARSLWGKASSIKLIDLQRERSDGSDVADWVAERRAAGHNDDAIRAELETLVAQAPGWTPSQGPPDGQHESSSSLPLTLSDGDDDGIGVPVELCALPKPGPRRWIVAGLLPANVLTVLYGDGGIAKSLQAMLISDCVARGRDLFSLPVEQGRVLYLDWELDQEEQTRRAYRVAAGLGHPSPAPGLYYCQMALPLGDALLQIATWVKELRISLTILDSFGLATLGDPAAAKDVVPLLLGVSRLPCTSLFIDHVRNLQPGEKGDDLNPFGSAYKRHIGRSVIQAVRVGGDEVSLSVELRHRESNFSALSKPLALRVFFEEDRVLFESVTVSPSPAACAVGRLKASDKVYQALLRGGRASLETLVAATGLALGTVKNELTQLSRQGKATPLGAGIWVPAATESSPSLALDASDDDDAPLTAPSDVAQEGNDG